MRFLIVDTYYPDFLDCVYSDDPDLAGRTYAEQLQTLMDQCFGTADFYSRNLQELGHEAREVVANCRPLQWRWAHENGFSPGLRPILRRVHGIPLPWLGRNWMPRILLEQVRRYRPDVIHFQDPVRCPASLLRSIRPHVKWITAQIASPVPARADFGGFDLMLSSLPSFVEEFSARGWRSAYFRLGFEPRVLERLAPRNEPRDVVFVGGLSPEHRGRVRFLDHVARRVTVEWWGYGVECLPSDSPLHATYRGPAWGADMYEKLRGARICLNHHIGIAGAYANNMRLYEATGSGCLLVTDWKKNLPTLFQPDREVVTYRTAEECAERVQHYLLSEPERATVARAGRQRTLAEHTYLHRMQEFVGLIEELLLPTT